MCCRMAIVAPSLNMLVRNHQQWTKIQWVCFQKNKIKNNGILLVVVHFTTVGGRLTTTNTTAEFALCVQLSIFSNTSPIAVEFTPYIFDVQTRAISDDGSSISNATECKCVCAMKTFTRNSRDFFETHIKRMPLFIYLLFNFQWNVN